MIRTSLLREQLKSQLGESVELEEDQVQVTLFALSNEEQANTISGRINDGSEDLNAIITELQDDDDESSYGYEAPWLPVGYLSNQLSIDIERVAFNTPSGRASEAIFGPGDLYYVVYVNGHEVRPLAEDILYQTREQEYNDWLLEQTDEQTEYLSWQDAILTSP